MESHADRDYWDRLRERAGQMKRDKASEITGGKEGEPVIQEYNYSGLLVTQRPADEQGILRISVGAGTVPGSESVRYCVYRGSTDACLALLEEAAAALRQYPLS